MAFSLLSMGGSGFINGRKPYLIDIAKSTSSDPPLSLWPEPSHPLPVGARRVQSNAAARTPGIPNHDMEGSCAKHEGDVHLESALISPDSVGSQLGSGSTFPSSDSTTASSPSPRPIDINFPRVFEAHYPTWHSYPPILPTTFETGTTSNCGPMKDEDTYFNHTGIFLEQSCAFQDWVEAQNANRIKLRHGANYEVLVDQLHKFQRLADQGPTPAVRTDARQHLLRIKDEMVEERKTFSAAELQHIRHIEKAWVSFVSIDKYEQEIARHRHMSALPRPVPKRTLSKIERLLGSDGSSLGSPTFTQPSTTRTQPTCDAMPWEDSASQSMDLRGYDSKELNANMWPDKPYEILIPDWFPISDAQGNIECKGATLEARFKNLTNFIHDLESAKRQLEYQEKHPDEEGIVKNYKWDKHWHQPNPGWRHEHQRQMGGLWKCRKGPDASAAEKKCRLCSKTEDLEIFNPAKMLEDLMKYIREAMAEVADKDKKEVTDRTIHQNGKPTDQEQEDLYNNNRTASEHETIPFGARQSYINHNPLRGLDDLSKATIQAESHCQALQMAVRGQGQGNPTKKAPKLNGRLSHLLARREAI